MIASAFLHGRVPFPIAPGITRAGHLIRKSKLLLFSLILGVCGYGFWQMNRAPGTTAWVFGKKCAIRTINRAHALGARMGHGFTKCQNS